VDGVLESLRVQLMTLSHPSSSHALGIGVIGYGYWGPNLVRNFANTEGARVISVSDLDPGKLALVRRRHADTEVTSDFRDLLKDGRIDAIAIATPVRTHYELALAALDAGKHVLIEKPLAYTSREALHLVEHATRQNLILMVDHTFLYTPAIQKMRDLIADTTIGDVYYYHGVRASLGLFQEDVNVAWDLAVHDISIIRYILSEEPIAVSATAASHVSGSPEDIAHITLFFQSSCIAHISVNWLSPVKVRQIFIGGSRKMIAYDDMEPTEKIKVYDTGVTVNVSPESAHQLRIGYRAGDIWAPHLSPKEALQTETEHFIDCLRGNASPISSGLSGLLVVDVLEAVSRSIALKGEVVRLENHVGELLS
jgi:predicted dehydrogenase